MRPADEFDLRHVMRCPRRVVLRDRAGWHPSRLGLRWRQRRRSRWGGKPAPAASARTAAARFPPPPSNSGSGSGPAPGSSRTRRRRRSCRRHRDPTASLVELHASIRIRVPLVLAGGTTRRRRSRARSHAARRVAVDVGRVLRRVDQVEAACAGRDVGVLGVVAPEKRPTFNCIQRAVLYLATWTASPRLQRHRRHWCRRPPPPTLFRRDLAAAERQLGDEVGAGWTCSPRRPSPEFTGAVRRSSASLNALLPVFAMVMCCSASRARRQCVLERGVISTIRNCCC